MKGNFLQRDAQKLGFGGGAPAPYLTRLNGEMLDKMKGGYIGNAYDATIKDSVRIVPGTAIGNEEIPLFSVPINGKGRVINTLAEYVKTERDTNMIQAGQIPFTSEFWAFSIQIQAIAIGTFGTTNGKGQVTNYAGYGGSTSSQQNAVAASGSNTPAVFAELNNLLNDGVFKNVLGTDTYEKDNLIMFPSEHGISGVAGRGDNGNNESIAQNGFGRARQLTVGHCIKGGTTIAPTVKFYSGIVPNIVVEIFFRYVGLVIEPIQ